MTTIARQMILSFSGLMGLHLMGAVDAYIPEPQPMRGDIEVTALYYPGTGARR